MCLMFRSQNLRAACSSVVSRLVSGERISLTLKILKEILLVLDRTTGLNMLPQAREFNDGCWNNKFDIDQTRRFCQRWLRVDELGIPVKFVGVGEGLECNISMN